MEPNNKLIKQSQGIVKTSTPSLQPQEITLLREMRLTAANAKIVLHQDLNEEFLRALCKYPSEAVESAFRAWRDVSPFFPAISDIRALCEVWCRRKRETDEAQRRAAERQESNVARERGELVDFADIVERLKDVCKMPERVPAQTRTVAMREPPLALQLTKEQVAARRQKEREEIERYKENA